MYKTIFNDTFRLVFEKKEILIKALLIYLLASIILDYVNISNTIYVDGREEHKNGIIWIAGGLLSYVIMLLTAISTHRILILGENSIPKWGLLKFTKREWAFFTAGIFMGLITIPVLIPVVLLGIPFGQVGYIIGGVFAVTIFLVVVSRISLVFPAISIDKEATFTDAWVYSKNYKLLVFFTIIIFPAIFTFAFGAIYGLFIGFLEKIGSIDLTFLNSILNIVITVFTISSLSATYRFITNEHPEYFNALEEQVPLRQAIIHSEEYKHTVTIHDLYDINFEQIKVYLKAQYFKLGFTNTTIDDENSWRIENPEQEEQYISLLHVEDEYRVEIIHARKPEFIEGL